MNLENTVFSFFIVLALTLNLGFVIGDIDNPAHHHSFELFAAIIANVICTLLKLGDRTHVGSTLLATSLVADLQLVACAVVWGVAVYGTGAGLTPGVTASIVSLAAGAAVANVVSVVLHVVEIFYTRH